MVALHESWNSTAPAHDEPSEWEAPASSLERILRAAAGIAGLAGWAAWLTASVVLGARYVFPFIPPVLGSIPNLIVEGNVGILLVLLLWLAVWGGFGVLVWGLVALLWEGLIQRSDVFDGEGLIKRVFGVTWWEPDGPATRSRAHRRRTRTETGAHGRYDEYLRSASWRQKRELMLRRAGHRCQLCNAKGRLEVHHRTYARIFNERPDDLIVLCSSCHQRHHGKERVA